MPASVRSKRCVGCWVGQKVKTIATSDLQAAMSSGDSPVLVDVRSDSEHAVSRIPGAITQQEYEDHTEELAGRRVVAYCTVGGRSYLFARKLVAGGVDAVELSRQHPGLVPCWLAVGIARRNGDQRRASLLADLPCPGRVRSENRTIK